jgi:putative phosphoribosyl transferase
VLLSLKLVTLREDITIPLGGTTLSGELGMPTDAIGLVLFAHGSGSSRHSPRNQAVAAVLREHRLGTLLFDLLTPEEERAEARTRHLRFDIELLTQRLLTATRWAQGFPAARGLRLGYFGASTGAAAALSAAARMGEAIGAVVSRGGRPDLASEALPAVTSATLLIVGERDTEVLALNRAAYDRLGAGKAMKIVPGATHLFEEPGALELVAQMAANWFSAHFRPAA